MLDATSGSYAALLLRLSLGVLFLLHGLYLRVFVFGMAVSAVLAGCVLRALALLGGGAYALMPGRSRAAA